MTNKNPDMRYPCFIPVTNISPLSITKYRVEYLLKVEEMKLHACIYSLTCSSVLRRMNVYSTVPLPGVNLACSFLGRWSPPNYILLIRIFPSTLLAKVSNANPLLFSHCRVGCRDSWVRFPLRPGTRFSKVPQSFRPRKTISKTITHLMRRAFYVNRFCI